MAAISGATFTSGEWLGRALTGAVNLRSSHSFGCRVKHSSTATNYDSVIAAYVSTSDQSGSYFGRNSSGGGGANADAVQAYRINLFGTVNGAAWREVAYGDTTNWYHLTFVFNSSTGFIRFYINGVFIAQQSTTVNHPSSSTSNTIGFATHPGKYADAFMFNRALTDQEVEDLFDYRVPQVTSGMVGFWRLDSDGTDTSGNSNTLTIQGSGTAITWSTSDNPPQPETPTVAIAGNAATASALSGALTKRFAVASNGFATASALSGNLGLSLPISGSAATASALSGAVNVNQALQGEAATASALAAWIRPRWGRRIGSASALSDSSAGFSPQSPFTVMTWIRPIDLAASTDSVTFSVNDGAGGDGLLLWVRNTSGTVQNRITFTAGGSQVIGYVAATDGDWHHLALTYDGTDARAYVDGSLVATAAAAPNAPLFDFVAWSTTSSSLAEFAHTKIWAGAALTAAEISSEANYYTPHTHNAQLYAWWQLAWNDVTLDSSGNGNTLSDSGSLEAQTESPGAPLTLLAGAAASASALAGELSQEQPLLGSAHTASWLAATLTVTVALAGAAATASALGGQLSQEQPLAGAAATASELSGTLAQTVGLQGEAATASAFTGDLRQALVLLGDSATASAFAGELGVLRPIAGDAHTASAFAGTLGVTGTFEGHAHTGSMLEGTLGVLRQVAGDAATASALTGVLSQLQPLTGAAASASEFAGTLSVSATVALAGDASTGSALSGELGLSIVLLGDAATASQLTGDLAVTYALAGDTATASALAGDLRLGLALVGEAATASELAGTLSVAAAKPLAGDAHTASALSGAITVVTQLSGAAHSGSQLGGTLNVDVIWRLTGAAWSASYLSGTLRVTHWASARGRNTTSGAAKAEYGPAVIRSPGIPRRWPPRY
jgi:hypothetical protein